MEVIWSNLVQKVGPTLKLDCVAQSFVQLKTVISLSGLNKHSAWPLLIHYVLKPTIILVPSAVFFFFGGVHQSTADSYSAMVIKGHGHEFT